MINRVLLPLVALGLALCGTASAQMQQTIRAQIQFQYHEPIPANGGMAAARAKIMADVEKDCQTAAKAFDAQCNVNNVNFNNNNFYAQQFQQQGDSTLSASASVNLVVDTPRQ